MILALLGNDDPEEVQAASPNVLRGLVSASGDQLRVRSAVGEWSVLELLGHILDAEMVSTARYRWVIAQDEPPLPGYDQDLWVSRLEHNQADAQAMLDLFDALRNANLNLWRRTTQEQRARVGVHFERGPESVDLIFRLIAGHDRFHLDQMARTLAAVKPSEASVQ
jgi:hypothetical protein